MLLLETPKKQNCSVRPTFGKFVLLDSRPTGQTGISVEYVELAEFLIHFYIMQK